MTAALALVVGVCIEPLCHLFGLPHPENLPAVLLSLSQSAHGLRWRL